MNVDDKTWLCHHCAWSGGIKEKDARKTWQDAPKPQAVRFHNDMKSDAMVDYFKSRGITKDVLESEKIVTVSAYGKEWIAFPYQIESEIVNVKYRGLSQKEFRQSKDGYKCFYRLDSIRDAKYAIICEGEIDALSFVQAGITNVVSVPEGGINPDAKNVTQKMSYVDNCIDYFDGKKYSVIRLSDGACIPFDPANTTKPTLNG